MKRRLPKRVLLASSWWNEDLIRGVAQHAAEAGWHLDLQMCLTGRLPEEWSGDGILVLPASEKTEMPAFLRCVGCPVVAIGLNDPRLAFPRVAFDSEALGRMAAEHFLERNFRSYVYHCHTEHRVDELRCAGFDQAIVAAGHTCTRLSWERDRRRRKNTWLNRQRWSRRKLRGLPKPLAVFSTDDTTAVEVIEAALAESLAIPDGVAILGTGNITVFRESTTVPLSSIVVDFDHLTHEACALLARLMDGGPVPRETMLLPPEGIAVRHSTDTIAAQTPEVAKAIRFMFDHFAEPIAVPDVVRASGMSKTRLYPAFERELGQSPGAVLTRIRIDRAKRMLHETNTKVHVISETCGFGDPVNLYRCFKRHLGVAPKTYRDT